MRGQGMTERGREAYHGLTVGNVAEVGIAGIDLVV